MDTANCGQHEFLRFLRAWAADPWMVGAVAPSGPALARLITSEVRPGDGPVLELGAGTGVFTQALIARGVAERDLTVIEYGADFARLLRERFPIARVLRMDATRLHQRPLFAGAMVSAVISGLPLLAMGLRAVIAILRGAFGYLRAGGAFYQFTYGPRSPVPRRVLDRLGLRARRIGGTLRNLPPASVYRITRRAELTPVAMQKSYR